MLKPALSLSLLTASLSMSFSAHARLYQRDINIITSNYDLVDTTYIDRGRLNGVKVGDKFQVKFPDGKLATEVVVTGVYERMASVKIVDSWLLKDGQKGAFNQRPMIVALEARQRRPAPDIKVSSKSEKAKTPVATAAAPAAAAAAPATAMPAAPAGTPALPGTPDAGALPAAPDSALPAAPDAGLPAAPDAGLPPAAGLPAAPAPGALPAAPDAGLPPAPDAAASALPPAPDAAAPAGLPPAPDSTLPPAPDAGLPPGDPGLPPM